MPFSVIHLFICTKAPPAVSAGTNNWKDGGQERAEAAADDIWTPSRTSECTRWRQGRAARARTPTCALMT